MTPRAFRALPRADQIEIMAHFQEEDLRKSHAEHVSKAVADMKDPNQSKQPPPRGR